MSITLILIALSGCVAPSPAVKRVALFAPFEGTYREVGYDALYPVRLAMADAAVPGIQLMPVDDGGSVEAAVLRAAALAVDPTVLLVLAVGPAPADPRVLAALAGTPVIVVGHWDAAPNDHVVVAASSSITDRLTPDAGELYQISGLAEVVGGDVAGMKAFADLAESTAAVTVLTSAGPPPPAFTDRLLASDLFVPEPGLLATLAYDAGLFASHVLRQASTRKDALRAVRTAEIDGINGRLQFGTDGYWADAPLYEYRYRAGVLVPADQ